MAYGTNGGNTSLGMTRTVTGSLGRVVTELVGVGIDVVVLGVVVEVVDVLEVVVVAVVVVVAMGITVVDVPDTALVATLFTALRRNT